ncbi:hypothetical protein K9O30_02125 [Clostridium bowmanii]|uniref:hypothetical protein n=1 Tax=Clostridium bowmanii TaxID=132925 RepID=UPI001C0DB186|nr:hypothetical protein [Clostridium bowmanii]MBU3190659.1 hypothetical protein [Clostridium bowmanii]MCA1072555.1 hypothetical protein [Clostridium bowmanii]
MKKISIQYRILFFVIITLALTFLSLKAKSGFNTGEEGLKITKWENFYTGDNIHFYYLSPQNENLLKIKATYKLQKVIEPKADELDNSIRIMKYLNGKVKAGSTSMTSDKNALEIMEVAFGGTKISDSDYAIMYEECLAAIGINVRRGVLRSNDKKTSGKSYFNVCEIWSDKYNKWVMIDGVNGCYMTDSGIPLGTVEIVDKGIEAVKIIDVKSSSKYIKNMSSYYESYSISVDNNKYGELKSNSKLTFLKNKKLPIIETKEGFIQPTIFVNNPQVFKESPKKQYVNNGTEKVPTLIFAKRDLKNDTKEIQNFTVGAFMNSYMLSNYFIKVNGGDYIKVDTYFDLQIISGTNSIKLSQDGKTLDREVIIEK